MMGNCTRWLGIGIQALTLGTLLFFAILKLLALTTGARVFQYEGF